jgi:hypothetical protein
MRCAVAIIPYLTFYIGMVKCSYCYREPSMTKKTPKTRHYRIHQLTAEQFEKNFPNEDACRAYLTKHRWPTGVVRCPRCGFEAKAHGTKPFHWQCYNCDDQSSYRFSVLVNTVFENTNKPLRDWFRVIHMMTTNKKGVSALQVFRTVGFGSYKTAWYMCHRIRVAMQDEEFFSRTNTKTSAAAGRVAAAVSVPVRPPLSARSSARATLLLA